MVGRRAVAFATEISLGCLSAVSDHTCDDLGMIKTAFSAFPVSYPVRGRLEPILMQPGEWRELLIPANDTTLSSPNLIAVSARPRSPNRITGLANRDIGVVDTC